MELKLSLLQLTFLYTVTQQVHSEVDIEHGVSKRQVSVLARDGHLPYEGKRYVGAKLDPEYATWEKPLYDDRESNEATDLFETSDKRYVGALAKSGDLRYLKQREDKRDELDTLIEELLTAEELKKIRLEALREELYREREENNEEIEEEKRSLSSLARGGNLPFRSEKRLAEDSIGYLGSTGFLKRGISSLARTGQLPVLSYGGKRSALGYLMRDNYPVDLTSQNAISPASIKRNIASVAEFRKNMLGKKSLFEDWFGSDDDATNELAKEKRYLGAFLASNQLPYNKVPSDYETKRNIGAMARNWNLPNYRYAKRYNENEDNENLLKNLAATLIDQNADRADEDKPVKEERDENKLGFGNLNDQKTFAMRKKKSVNLEEQSLAEKEQQQSAQIDENKTHNDVDRIHRSKREAFDDSGVTSEEYTMPVLQNTDLSEYDDLVSKSNGDQSSSRTKRYFAVAVKGGGKIPGGRLPGIGTRRNSDRSSGRRRH